MSNYDIRGTKVPDVTVEGQLTGAGGGGQGGQPGAASERVSAAVDGAGRQLAAEFRICNVDGEYGELLHRCIPVSLPPLA